MDELEFFVKIAGKARKVRMQASVFGARAHEISYDGRVLMMGYDAVSSAFKISKENGKKAEAAKKSCQAAFFGYSK